MADVKYESNLLSRQDQFVTEKFEQTRTFLVLFKIKNQKVDGGRCKGVFHVDLVCDVNKDLFSLFAVNSIWEFFNKLGQWAINKTKTEKIINTS